MLVGWGSGGGWVKEVGECWCDLGGLVEGDEELRRVAVFAAEGVCVCVCACVYVRERERERAHTHTHTHGQDKE